MTVVAAALLIVSALIHAVWNLIGKRNDPSPSFFLLANTLGCSCMGLVMCAHFGVAARFPAHVWFLLTVTGLFQAIYFSGLAAAYRSGHLSVAYPLIRSAPVILVATASLMAGKGYQLTALSITGMALIAAGSLILPIGRFSDWKLSGYWHPSSLFVLAAAVGTAGYSIVDDAALRLLHATPDIGAGRVTLTLVYGVFEGLSASAWLAVFLLFGRGSSPSPKLPPVRVGSAALAGAGIFAAYALVLLAMSFVRNVSYVVAFRQLSIPIGTLLGITVLGEPRNAPKLIGLAVMLAGLLLVALR